jgi:hypothetical protein
MQQAEFEQHVGQENICPHINEALERAKLAYGGSKGVGEQVAGDVECGPVLPTEQTNCPISVPGDEHRS